MLTQRSPSVHLAGASAIEGAGARWRHQRAALSYARPFQLGFKHPALPSAEN